MGVAQHRRQPAGQRGVDQDRIEIDGNFGRRDRMPFVGNAVVQIGQRVPRQH